MTLIKNDTIVALSTPPGRSGVGLIRVSGPHSVSIVRSIFKTRDMRDMVLQDRRSTYGILVEPATGRVLDDGIAVLMKGPSSYTGEDMLELGFHGSPVILQKAISIICSLGARLAKRGEFTRRAFLAGKLDLIQAEAVVDLIDSETMAQADDARSRIDRQLSDIIVGMSSELKDIGAELEAYIDFDDDEEGERPHPIAAVARVIKKVEELLRDSHAGRFRNRGLTAVITGKPNVGKSTLFNRLLGSDRMIISSEPGTTRDPVSEKAYINGVAITLGDTAGIRDNPDTIEKLGIDRTVQWVSESDIAIVVFDITQPMDDDDRMVVESVGPRDKIFALNKIDKLDGCQDSFSGVSELGISVRVSARMGEGLDLLREKIGDLAESMLGSEEFGRKASLNDRAILLMESAGENLRNAMRLLEDTGPPELVSFELKAACDKIDEITGQKFTDDVLDRIFERFCVGK